MMKKFTLFVLMFSLSLFSAIGQSQVYMSISQSSQCEDGLVDFYNYSSYPLVGGETWEWNINGAIFNDFELFGLSFSGGNYNVNLTLYDSVGGYLGGEYQYFTVYPSLNGFNVSGGGQACPGESLNFSFNDAIYPWSIRWTWGDNSLPDYQDTYNYPNHTFYKAGTFDVTLMVDHQCGTDTVVQQVIIGGSAKPEVLGYLTNGPDYCPGDPVSFDVQSNFVSYLWNFGDGKTSTERNPTHVYPNDGPGIYFATVTATNSCGQNGIDSVNVGFQDSLNAWAEFNYNFDNQSGYPCPGTPVEFRPYSSGVYEWDFGDGSRSNEQYPVNTFTSEGQYTVILTLFNGCGQSDTWSQMIEVMNNPDNIPNANFYTEIEGMHGEQFWEDTIKVCPGLLVNFRNQTYAQGNSGMSFHWNFGDGASSMSKNASHVYTIASAIAYPVTFSVTNACGGTGSITRYVLVDAGLLPDSGHGVVPEIVCSGDEVFYYLDNDIEYGNYTYNIDFGDGTTQNNITEYGDTILQTLANHVYTGAAGDTFNYVFTATNLCGNKAEKIGTITITDNPLLKPFYYVDNTTSSGDNEPMEDWSYRRDVSDHEFVVHYQWPAWPGTQDKFAIYFWYDGFNPDYDPGNPNGFVIMTSSTVMEGDSVKAYIPLNPNYSPTVGFAVGWTCDAIYDNPDNDPDVWGMQFDFGYYNSLTSFPLNPMGYTNMNSFGDPVQLDLDMSWDGLCNSERPASQYNYRVNAGQYMQLNLDGDMNQYNLFGSYDPDGYDYITTISQGDYYIPNKDTIVFTDWYDCVEMTGTYRYSLNGDKIDFFLISDGCTNRIKYLTDSTFTERPEFSGEMYSNAGCPGDNVNFTIAGGSTWEWHFGDGSAVSTERYPVHQYALPDNYDAFVISTNSCGRVDTIHTPVEIAINNPPQPWFNWDGSEYISRFEPISFYYDEWSDQAGNNSYLWDFGDGITSTLRNPVHAYEKNGEFIVTLTITNGCGSSTGTQYLYIQEAIMNCEAKFAIDSITGKTAYFGDASMGEITKWFWDFGDGFTSSEQLPIHTFDRDGIYFVCLSIFDSINNCSDQVCRQIEIGAQLCIADFIAQVNTATNKVQFTDRSTNATEYFWDFGDGSFSDLKDPLHAYNQAGWYYICLSTYNKVSDCFAYKCLELQVGELDSNVCKADFSYFVDEASNKVIFTDKSSDNITNWYWTLGDGTFIEDRNPVKQYTAPGIYPVCLIVFDQNSGCSNEICMDIQVGIAACNITANFAFFIDMTNNEVSFSDRSVGKPTKWFWDFGDGGTSSVVNPRHKYLKAGFYLVTLSVQDPIKGCKDYKAGFIQIGTVDCKAAFEYKVDASTRNVQFYNQSSGSLSQYFWDFGDGTYSDLLEPMHQYSRAGMYIASLTVINDNGLCMDFMFESIQVGTVTCAASFTHFIDSATNIAYFSPKAMGTSTAYSWYFGDGSISTSKEAKHQFKFPGYYTVGLNTFDGLSGCMDYKEKVILIGSAGQDCRSGFIYVSEASSKKVSFSERSKGNILEYIWDFGDRNYSFDPNPVHTYVRGGYYPVCLTVLNEFGISNTFCMDVQIATSTAEDCLARFNFTVDSISRKVDFVQVSNGNPDGFLWKFGDGTTSGLENPQHTYGDTGLYTVVLSIKNSASTCTSKRTKLVNVGQGNQGLRSGFSYDIDSSNLKADSYPVDFIGVSLGDAGKLKWSFGDGSSDSTTMNPRHIYSEPGIYDVCLTISNPVSGDKSTSCEKVEALNQYTDIDPSASWNSMLGNYPNPFDVTTYVVYELPWSSTVDLVLFDQTGRMVDILVREDQMAGSYRLEYVASKLRSGMYTLRLVTDQGVYTSRMVVR